MTDKGFIDDLLEEGVNEDREILQPDGSRACYNYETPDWEIVNPMEYCVWKEVYENNQKGVGTSFSKEADKPCRECYGYDKTCLMYIRGVKE